MEKPTPTALVFPAKFFEIGGTNVLSTIDSGHGKKLKLFVFPSSCLTSLPVEICTNCSFIQKSAKRDLKLLTSS